MFDPSNYACLPDGDCGDGLFWMYVFGLMLIVFVWTKLSQWRNK